MLKGKRIPILALILLAIPAVWNLFQPGYFFMHDDLQVMRLFEMETCMKDGQLPCRWVPDMGAGYGLPLFNFYAPLPYYAGMALRIFGFSYLATVKLLFAASLLASGLFMYYLSKEFFGKAGGLLSSIFYVYAPYRAVDVYVRGALGESWGLMLFPLILWSLYKFFKEKKLKYFVISILSLSGLLLSHNIMALIFVPAAFAWAIYWRVFYKEGLARLLLIFVWSLLLSAFFTIPAFLERSLIQVQSLTSDYYDFRHHFAGLRQLFFERSWGYGPSIPGTEDQLSFQLGILHWTIAGLVAAIVLARRRKELYWKAVVFMAAFSAAATFMTHAKSFYIWEALPLIAFVQFPWRFLSLASFSLAFLAGGFVLVLPEKRKAIISSLLLAVAIFLNLVYFTPKEFYPQMTDEEKLSGKQWEQQSKAAILDYLPLAVKRVPRQLAPESPWVSEGQVNIVDFHKRSDVWSSTVEVFSEEAVVSVPIFYFPEWDIFVDDKPVEFRVDDELGVLEVKVNNGRHILVGWFKNTKIREVSNALTLFSTASFFLYVIFRKLKDEKAFQKR